METKGTIEQALVKLERTVPDYNYKKDGTIPRTAENVR